jgi:hypothetical protein
LARRLQRNLDNPLLFANFKERMADQVCNDASHGGVLLTELTIAHPPEKRGISREDPARSANLSPLEIQYETPRVVQSHEMVFRWTMDRDDDLRFAARCNRHGYIRYQRIPSCNAGVRHVLTCAASYNGQEQRGAAEGESRNTFSHAGTPPITTLSRNFCFQFSPCPKSTPVRL